MNKILVPALLAALLLAGCGKAPRTASAGTQAPRAARRPLVTFIELGSVNCIPCKMMQPVMREIEQRFPRDVEVVFYDVWTERQRQYAAQYNIRVIPTQVFLDAEGQEFFRHEGFFPKEELVELLRQKGAQE
jgi:thioredoxin 1